ncbi:aldehyde dehydrogenase family protein [Endozoicomonas sp. SM1973]|uniref:Aldehyde dehydrogenase family protein n=2 Tax=Spartinivicinus marinus TaxID=2994442 RepID=A0A853IF46_9GAMM|nr:aldehyde dehydrogenase family protein [Spartinivicinus marinus]MCX4025848.1 aldehyde dehydrogenase family protein [Spartinivicinus marinus]NYZ68664.1 aldehyde dehydrogenase family protein [Spartinivicinus marinus]
MMDYQIINPYNNNLLGEFNYTSVKEAESALSLTENSKQTLALLCAAERSEILERLERLLAEHKEQLADLITQETGKTISDSRVELDRAINTTKACSIEARKINGELLDSDAYSPKRGKWGLVCWRPIGVVLCITPFNFPINIAMHKIGPAFAAGNPILFKPAPQNYLSAKLLVDLCYEAGIPRDTLKLVLPDIPVLSDLIADPRVAAINFTGGSQAGEAIANRAGYKKLLFELGGNDPLIIMPDGNIEQAINVAINQRFATAGQRCTAAKRIYVHQLVYSQFVEGLLAKAAELRVGDPTDPATFVGPLINKQAADVVEQRINQAVESGATVLLGNKRDNNIIYPTILENVATDSELVKDETFGPVMPIHAFNEINDIIPLVNDNPYGLQAGIFTESISLAKDLFEKFDVGTLAVNDGPGFRAEHFPFGGVKASGVGREGIYYAIREMSIQKTLVI